MADPLENEPIAVENEDGGIIRCICGYPEDDGSTIQCDVCDVWQHFLCIDIDENNVPDEYLCDECSPRELDAVLARERQSRRSVAEQHLRTPYSAALSPDLEMQIKATARAFALGEVELDLTAAPLLQEPLTPQQLAPAPPGSKKRPTSTQTSAPPGQHESFVGQPPPSKKKRKARQSVQPVSYSQAPLTPGTETPSTRRPNTAPILIDDDDKQESWIYEYTNVQEPLWDNLEAIEQVRAGLQSWFARIGQPCQVRAQKIANPPGSLPTHHVRWSRTPTAEADAGYFASYSEQQDLGLCAPLAPRYHHESKHKLAAATATRVVVGNIPSSSFSLAPPLSTPFTPSNTFTAPTLACPYPRPVAQALYAKTPLFAGNFIAPFYGQVTTRSTYHTMPSNQYDLLGVPKPGVRALPLPWSIMIDARHYGNEVRFARSGCLPNAIIRPIIHSTVNVSPTEEGFDVAFGLYATQDIAKKEEIVVSWDWDDHHLIHLLPKLLFEPDFRSSIPLPIYSQQLARISSTLFPLSPCACTKRKSCALSWMYRLACCSQPASLGSTKSRDHLDSSLVEEKIQALLVGGGRGGKKGVELDSINYRRGWEHELEEPSRDEMLKPQVKQSGSEPDKFTDADDFDKQSQVSVDSDATEPLSRHEDTLEYASKSLEDGPKTPPVPSSPPASILPETKSNADDSVPTVNTASATSNEQAVTSENLQSPTTIEKPDESYTTEPKDSSTVLGASQHIHEKQQPLPPAVASIDKSSNDDHMDVDQSTKSSPLAKETSPAPEPAPEPVKPRTPSPPPVPKAKVSFAAFMKRWKDKPEPAKADTAAPPVAHLDASFESVQTDAESQNSPSVDRSMSLTSASGPEASSKPLSEAATARGISAEEGPVYRPNSPVYRPESPIYKPDSPPTPKPVSPVYRPSSPPVAARLSSPSPPAIAPTSATHGSNSGVTGRASYPSHDVPNRSHVPVTQPERPSYFPSTSAFQYEPTLRSSELRSPSPALSASAKSDRRRRSSLSPPSSARYQNDYPSGSPPAGPRYYSNYGRWPPRGRGRGYGPPPPSSSSSHLYSNREPRRPDPPRAPRALQAGPPNRPSVWSSQAPRAAPPPISGADRGTYRGVPRGPRGSGWRPRGRGRD